MKNNKNNNDNEKLTQEVAELKARIAELESQVKIYSSNPKNISPLWIPRETEDFWVIKANYDEVTVSPYEYTGDDCGKKFISIGNYFKTSADAREAFQKLNLLQEVKVWKAEHDPKSFDKEFIFNTDNLKYYLHFNLEEIDDITYESTWFWVPLCPVGYFTSESIIQKFIEHFTSDRLIKLFTI